MANSIFVNRRIFPSSLSLTEVAPFFTPPPLRGGGWEGGDCGRLSSPRRHFTPTPTLPPQGGGGKRAVLLSQKRECDVSEGCLHG